MAESLIGLEAGRVPVQNFEDAFPQLIADDLIAVDPNDPVAGRLLRTMVEVSIDVVAALDESDIGITRTDSARLVIREHVDDYDFVTEPKRLQSRHDNARNILRG